MPASFTTLLAAVWDGVGDVVTTITGSPDDVWARILQNMV